MEAHRTRSQGYHLVKGKPTDEDRARYDKLATFNDMQTEGGDAPSTAHGFSRRPVGLHVDGHYDAFGAKPEPVTRAR